MKTTSKLQFQASGNPQDGFRLPRLLEALFVVLIFLELLAPFVTTTLGLDGRLQLKMVVEFNKLLSSGILVPTWAPDGFYNFGATSFYFYPPLTFYLTSIVGLTGMSNPMALFQAVSLLATIASFFTVRWMLRKVGSSGYRLSLASALYAFAPLRVAELYSRSSLSTHVTYVLLPLILGALIAIVREDGTSRTKRVLLLALWCALLALTNVPITVMMAMSIGIAAIAVWKKLTWNAVGEVALAATIAAGLAAYHYASVLSAQSFARLQYLYFIHRPSDIELYFHLGPGTYHLLALYAGIGIIVSAYARLRWKRVMLSDTEDTVIRIGLSITAFVLFLDFFPLSAAAWNAFQSLQLIQFPWRFYSLLLLFAVIVVGTARSSRVARAAKWISALWIAGAMLPTILVVFNVHVFSHFESPLEDAPEFLPIFFNPSHVSNGGTMQETIDQTLQPHASDPVVLGDFTLGERVERTMARPYHETLSMMLEAPRTITFHRFYWPYWHLYANGKELHSRPDSIGRATAMLPAGHYAATWQLQRTPLECAGLWISGLTAGGILLLGAVGYIRQKRKIGGV